MNTTTKKSTAKSGAQPVTQPVAGKYTVDDLAAAFARAGQEIQWVGVDKGKPMTMGSVELTELLKVVDELPARAPAGTQSPLPTGITQAAPADLFADAIARLAAHDHAAATALADKYRASLTVASPASANELKVAQATLNRAYEIVGLGAEARKPGILLTNIENAVRRTACLSRIESIMTTLRIEDGEEVEECPMNWGANPEEYAEQFQAAIAHQAKLPALVAGYKLVVFDEPSPEGNAVAPFVIDAKRALTFSDEPGWLASHIEDLYRMVTPVQVCPEVPVIPLTGYGQVQKGDVLLVKRSNEFVAPVEVKDVLQAGTDDEEIILSAAKNVYFIVRKFLAGESWIKECSKLVNGRIYSITNNQRDILCNTRDDRAVRAPRATAAEENQA